MSNLSDKIREREKRSRQNKLIMNILGVVVIIFIGTSVMLYYSLEDEKRKLIESETELIASEKSLIDSNKELEIKEAILKEQNNKLLELRGSLEKEWNRADMSGKIKDYASYLERAIEDDDHYSEALQKMNTLANDKGYVQITDSNGTKYLEKIENLNTDDVFYRVIKDMNVRNGVLGHPDFSNRNTSRNGDIIRIGDVVKITQPYSFNSGAEWAEIRYDK